MRERSDGPDVETKPPYSVLAAVYDFVMSHVDYERWAAYVHQLLMRHRPGTNTILELGCGTGSLAVALQALGSYSYVATDGSEHMLEVARRKAADGNARIRFDLIDFTDFRVDTPVDAVLLLYDGLNYLTEPKEIGDLLLCVFNALNPGGVFVVDQSTPSNSIRNEDLFDHSDRDGEFSYVRRSRYDADTRIHRTMLEISVGERRFREVHLQMAYDIDEMRALITAAGLVVDGCYDGFSTTVATEHSERVHWVLRRPSTSIAES